MGRAVRRGDRKRVARALRPAGGRRRRVVGRRHLPPPVRPRPPSARPGHPGGEVRHHGHPLQDPPGPEAVAWPRSRPDPRVAGVPPGPGADARVRRVVSGSRSVGKVCRWAVPSRPSRGRHRRLPPYLGRLSGGIGPAGSLTPRAADLARGDPAAGAAPGAVRPPVPVHLRQRVVELAVPRRPAADGPAPPHVGAGGVSRHAMPRMRHVSSYPASSGSITRSSSVSHRGMVGSGWPTAIG